VFENKIKTEMKNQTIQTKSTIHDVQQNFQNKKNRDKKKRSYPPWEHLLEAANRAEQVGRVGIQIHNRYWSSDEIAQKCVFASPLPPFRSNTKKSNFFYSKSLNDSQCEISIQDQEEE
jgi:hypothetical protein